MAAYDNVSLAGPPNIATAGNYAQLLTQGLSQLGKDYQSGQEFNYQQQQRNLFQNGIPTNAQGQPDFYGMLQKMIQSGGAPVAGQVLPMLQKQPFMDAALKEYQNDSGQPVNTAPAASPTSGPANITGQSPSRQPTQVSETQGGDRINNLAADRGIDLDQFLGKYPGFRSLLNQDLTPGQAKAVTQRMDAMRGGGASANPIPQAGLAGDDNNTNQQTPTGSMGGGGPISPAPTAASGNIGGAPSGGRQPLQVTVPIGGSRPASFDERFNSAFPSMGGGPESMVPKGTDPLAYAQALRKRAEALRRSANTQGIIGIPTKAKEDQAAALDKQADAITEQLGKPANVTPEMRNVASGAARTQEQIKTDTERYGKQYDNYQHQADESYKLVDTLKLTKSLMDDPNFYSGTGEEHVLEWKRIGASLGFMAPDAAQAQEVFRKTVSTAIMDQIRSLGGQGLGQVRVAEINVMKQAAQNSDNTPASNRLLTELQSRMAEKWTIPIAEAAQRYNNGHLDAGFDRWKADYINSHPLLSKEELADARRIAPPLARTPADLAKIGWKDGMPFRTGRTLPDGRPEIFTHAPKGGPAPAAPAFNPNGA